MKKWSTKDKADKQKYKSTNKSIKKIGFLHKGGLVISFIILQFIKPIWGQKGILKILKGMLMLVITPIGVITIDNNRYLTKINGWEQLDKLLQDKGYQTHVLFRQCEFWKEQEKKRLKGKNIGEFFILWQGDCIE